MRTYLCPDCDGHGLTGEDFDCLWCESTGVITADADTADLRSLQPWTGSIGRAASRVRGRWVDPLHELARTRKAGIRWRSAAYADARQRAMQRVHGLPRTDFLAGCRILVDDVRRIRAMLKVAA